MSVPGHGCVLHAWVSVDSPTQPVPAGLVQLRMRVRLPVAQHSEQILHGPQWVQPGRK